MWKVNSGYRPNTTLGSRPMPLLASHQLFTSLFTTFLFSLKGLGSSSHLA